jgi:hypothetical protein
MRKEIASWDEGWSGKYIHACPGGEENNRKTMDVQDSEDKPILYVQIDGEKFSVWKKRGRIGF